MWIKLDEPLFELVHWNKYRSGDMSKSELFWRSYI